MELVIQLPVKSIGGIPVAGLTWMENPFIPHFPYPLILANGRSLTMIRTRSAWFAMTSSMSL